jgi:hypothetical protein
LKHSSSDPKAGSARWKYLESKAPAGGEIQQALQPRPRASPVNVRISIVDASAVADDFFDIRAADTEIVEFTIGQTGQFTDGFAKPAPSMELRGESLDHGIIPFY